MEKIFAQSPQHTKIEVRSDGGKLLFIKTSKGYEMRCPRTKNILLVSYQEMLRDCIKYLKG